MHAREHTAQVPRRGPAASARQDFREGRAAAAVLLTDDGARRRHRRPQRGRACATCRRRRPTTPSAPAAPAAAASRRWSPPTAPPATPTTSTTSAAPGDMVAGSVAPPRLDLTNEDLLRSHVHAIWLAETDQSMHSSITDLLDADGDNPACRCARDLDSALRDRTSPAGPSSARPGGRWPTSPHLGAGRPRTSWWSEGWVHDQVARAAADAFDEALRPLARALPHAPLTETRAEPARASTAATAKAGIARRPNAAAARPRPAHAAHATRTASDADSDFYSYRYFASEGFLPGYSFPRLPLAAYIPAPRGADRRRRLPAAAAVRRDQRVRARRADLPRGRPLRGHPRAAAAQAPGHGQHRRRHGGPDAARAAATTTPVKVGIDVLRELRGAARRDPVRAAAAADGLHPPPRTDQQRRGGTPQERLRARSLLPVRRPRRPSRAAPPPGDRRRRRPVAGAGLRRQPPPCGSPTSAGGAASTRATAATGWTRARATGSPRSRLPTPPWTPDELDDAEDVQHKEKVTPYVEDRRNILVLRLADAGRTGRHVTLRAALERGIEAEFQLEDSELASEELPDLDDRGRMLLTESRRGRRRCAAPARRRAGRARPRRPHARWRSSTTTRTPAPTSATRPVRPGTLREGLLRLPAVLRQPDRAQPASTGTRGRDLLLAADGRATSKPVPADAAEAISAPSCTPSPSALKKSASQFAPRLRAGRSPLEPRPSRRGLALRWRTASRRADLDKRAGACTGCGMPNWGGSERRDRAAQALARPSLGRRGPRLSLGGRASDDGVVDVELLVIPQCPGTDAASELLRGALDDIGLAGTPFTVRVIDTEQTARACRFAGSPAFVVDGVDLFDSRTTGGSMRRAGSTGRQQGPRNVPALPGLRRALKERAGSSEEDLSVDTPPVTAHGQPDPPQGRCWCCGSIDDPDRMVHLGIHPEVALCTVAPPSTIA